MKKETMDRIVKTITAFVDEKQKNFNQLAQKMNEDYDWFFRYRADDAFILNFEIKHLKDFLKKLEEENPDNIEDLVDCEIHYHLQKLVSDPIIASTNVHMFNEAYIHERTVYQRMYNTLIKLKTIYNYKEKLS